MPAKMMNIFNALSSNLTIDASKQIFVAKEILVFKFELFIGDLFRQKLVNKY